MKLATCVVFVLADLLLGSAQNPHILSYSLRIIEYLMQVQVGTFECIFFDMTSKSPYDNVLSVLLQSPRLESAVKYVLQGSGWGDRSEALPKTPSLLVLYPGREGEFTAYAMTRQILEFFNLFDPATVVMTFMEFSELNVAVIMDWIFNDMNCNNVLYLDTLSTKVRLKSLKNEIGFDLRDSQPHPKRVFDWFRYSFNGNVITYVPETMSGDLETASYKWVKATADYLNCALQVFPGGPTIAHREIIHGETMKLATCVVFVLANLLLGSAQNPHVLDYSLRIIEYLMQVQVGTFECIFFDMTSKSPYDNVLSVLLQSPKLESAVKYVLQGSGWGDRSEALPKSPSLLVLYPGRQVEFSLYAKTRQILKFFNLFDPATVVMTFMDFAELSVGEIMNWIFNDVNCNNALFFDTFSTHVRLKSLKNSVVIDLRDGQPHPKRLFGWFRYSFKGNTITYVPEKNTGDLETASYKWVKATAEYLNGKLRMIPKDGDIRLRRMVLVKIDRTFQGIAMCAPTSCRILIPRGRRLTAVEIMTMPFKWQVWTLLAIALVVTEVVRYAVPDSFKNDPILLVVCGFERHDLHRAGRWERAILHSLIVVMFFMTNAFETKIISMMIDRPSAQTAKRLDDFDKYGLKFRFDLNQIPDAVEHPLIGRYVEHGDPVEIFHNEPGVAIIAAEELVAMVPKLSYDYERGQSWFIVLEDQISFDTMHVYQTAVRSPYLGIFQFTYVALNEAGLFNLWQRQQGDHSYKWISGNRPRGNDEEQHYLVFDDMLVAWLVLAFGYGISLIGFVWEMIKKSIAKGYKKDKIWA
ncbi:conserved hypothetical protein [Culex quinquefasciatus]|uniref:Ionotropic glutamate receptor L-glutamate and glycine-binding domain-containing protein n=1 Tax=Culex quinquefasciatus TaxID=7176 RepID=B0WJN6_CULQU|nr:conserved hypothetical protein [Culex quinquefasciatus]|eukprot:XP_001848920.1 conserved hypothetical protein [Culex quinquefasciatus]